MTDDGSPETWTELVGPVMRLSGLLLVILSFQESTLLDMAPDPEAAFFEIVASIPPGRTFTVNDLRDRLDAADIPAPRRGPLFAAACAAELIEPVRLTAWGRTTDVYVPSTGRRRAFAR